VRSPRRSPPVAVAASPTLAQLDSKTVDSALLDAGMAVLDRFSRYEPPEAVPLDLVDWDEREEPMSVKIAGDARAGPPSSAVLFLLLKWSSRKGSP